MKATIAATTTATIAGLRGQFSQQWKVMAAFAAVYLIWGSTYLAIRFAIESLPPFLMAGARFVVSGSLVFVWARWRGAPLPTRRQWRDAAVIGALLLLLGNGSGVSAQQRHVPSGLVALLIAMTPIWVTLLEWLRRSGTRPTGGMLFGLLIGFAGVALLIGPHNLAASGGADLLGVFLALFASFVWAAGSIYSRQADQPGSPLMATGAQMLCGGAMLLVASGLRGDWVGFDPAAVTARSAASFAYLVIFGSLVAFTAFTWLLKHAEPARVATYAYVNPVIAVFLGWALAGEPLTPQTLIAAAVIVGSVAIIVTYRGKK